MRQSSAVRFLWLLPVWMVVILSYERVRAVAAAELPGLSTSSCTTDSNCEKNYKCFVQDRANSDFCIPKDYYGSDHDEEACLHRANCAASAALRLVCPACILTPILTCGGVPASDAWYREHWEPMKDCFTPTPEQIRASAVHWDRRKSYRVKRGGPIEIERPPDLGIMVNDWNISVPAEWAGPRSDEASTKELYRRKGRVENALNRRWEFNAACPIYDEDIGTRTYKQSFIAGTCGAFRNPDPRKPPPSLKYLPNK
jgi:hypothetical protein